MFKTQPDRQLLAYLRDMDLEKFERDAISFAARDLEGTDIGILRDMYYELVAPSGSAQLSQQVATYPIGTVFWRVRAVNSNETAHAPTIREQQDLWWPPAQVVKSPGRLNKVGEPLLYVCAEDPFLAITEGRIAEQEDFYLIRYVAQRALGVCMIPGPPPQKMGLRGEIRVKYEALYEFHRQEFTREVENDGPGAYLFSEFVAKETYDLPPVLQDAWCYPSALGPSRVNVALRPLKALEVLRCVGAAKCRWTAGDISPKLALSNATTGSVTGGRFDWHSWPDAVVKAAFPEFD